MPINRSAQTWAVAALVFSVCGLPAQAKVPPAAGDVAAAAAANNAFAAALYQKLQSDPSANLFFSPYSISSALAMASAGAAGETQKQIVQVLHFSLPQARLDPSSAALRLALLRGVKAESDFERQLGDGEPTGFDLRLANRLWGQAGSHFVAEFLRICRTDYDAELGQVDFRGQTDAARQTINAWIEEQTNHKIQSMIAPGALSNQTRLALTSAIYFKARWRDPFEESATAEAPFHVSAGTEVKVPLMHQQLHAKHADLGTFQMLALPYGWQGASKMIILLPKDPAALAQMENQITSENLGKWSSRLAETLVDLALPKFKVSASLDLNDTLKALGMTLAFDSQRADFSRIDSQEKLFLSEAKHQAFVEINENGTEAAAATVLIAEAADKSLDEPVEFRADHPFVFLIRDNATQTILFLGRLVNPAPQ